MFLDASMVTSGVSTSSSLFVSRPAEAVEGRERVAERVSCSRRTAALCEADFLSVEGSGAEQKSKIKFLGTLSIAILDCIAAIGTPAILILSYLRKSGGTDVDESIPLEA